MSSKSAKKKCQKVTQKAYEQCKLTAVGDLGMGISIRWTRERGLRYRYAKIIA